MSIRTTASPSHTRLLVRVTALYSFAGPGLSNFEHEWNLPGLVVQYEAMAEEHTIVRFDWRNSGLSTRHVDDVTIEAHLQESGDAPESSGLRPGRAADSRQRTDRDPKCSDTSGSSVGSDLVEPIGVRWTSPMTEHVSRHGSDDHVTAMYSTSLSSTMPSDPGRASYITQPGAANGARAGRTDRRQVSSSAPGTRNSSDQF